MDQRGHHVPVSHPLKPRSTQASLHRHPSENVHPNQLVPPSIRRVNNMSSTNPKSAQEVRRINTMNMEKMIKKNVMAAVPRPGTGMKRGLAVVEYFKQQQQEQDQETHPPSAKRARDSQILPQRASTTSVGLVQNTLLNTFKHEKAVPSSPHRLPITQQSPSPMRHSPARVRTARPMPEMCLPVDQMELAATTSTKPPSKSPFLSFQSKLEQSKQAQVSTAPSPALIESPARPPRPYPRAINQALLSPVRLSGAQRSAPSPSRPQRSPSRTHRSPSRIQRSPARTQPSETIVDLTLSSPVLRPSKPHARSLFTSSSDSVATKSLCFSTEGVASSIDVSPDGECIVVAFTDGSVRMYEMDSTVPSDRHGYLLGHLDEESNQSSAGAHLRVKISHDGRYAFVGCRSGPRIMMSINLHQYRNGKGEEEDGDQLQKSFHANNRLRGFSDVTNAPSTTSSHAYYLLCGLGVGTLNLWRFQELPSTSESSPWEYISSLPTNGNTAIIAHFLPSTQTLPFQLIVKCSEKNIRMWDLALNEIDQVHTIQKHRDVSDTKKVVTIAGRYAYSISGETISQLDLCTNTSLLLHIERFETSQNLKSRRSTVILETIHAAVDGSEIVVMSSEGIMYYTNQPLQDGLLKIMSRNMSYNAQFKTCMTVYRPISSSSQELLPGILAVVTNPPDEEGKGFINIDLTKTWLARWGVPSQSKECWVCGVRNISHWGQTEDSKQPRLSITSRTAVSLPISKDKEKIIVEKKREKLKAKPKPVPRVSMTTPPSTPQETDLSQELSRYKERYQQIVTEWQRRLQGERQMRRLWKQRDTEFQSQLQEAMTAQQTAELQLKTLQSQLHDKEKEFVLEKLKSDQETSVKSQYSHLCEQLQLKLTQLDQQQRLMEQSTKTLLQEVDKQVHASKQHVSALVTQQNECVLCRDTAAVVAIVPCGHLCFCEEDAQRYQRQVHGDQSVGCPICQRECISFLRIY